MGTLEVLILIDGSAVIKRSQTKEYQMSSKTRSFHFTFLFRHHDFRKGMDLTSNDISACPVQHQRDLPKNATLMLLDATDPKQTVVLGLARVTQAPQLMDEDPVWTATRLPSWEGNPSNQTGPQFRFRMKVFALFPTPVPVKKLAPHIRVIQGTTHAVDTDSWTEAMEKLVSVLAK